VQIKNQLAIITPFLADISPNFWFKTIKLAKNNAFFDKNP